MNLTRRRFLAAASSALAAARLQAQPGFQASSLFNRHKPKPGPAAQPFVYIGTDTSKPGAQGIYVCRLDPATGRVSPPVLAAETFRPSFFAFGQSRGRRMVYVANEGDDKTSAISTFAANPTTGILSPLGKVSSAGAGPCFVSLDAQFQSAYVADYVGAAVATYRIQPDGTLTEPVEHLNFRDPRFGHHGPNADRQDAPHPHSALLSPDNRFLLVNDLGNDTLVTLPVDPATARLGPPTVIQRHPGSGPRHLAFHPNGRWIYSVDELTNQIDQFLFNTTHGDPKNGVPPQALLTDAGHTVSTLDPGFHGPNTAAEIVISIAGLFLYVSNRGEDSLVVFALDQASGAPKFIQRISCGGRHPRQFTLDATGRWLLCGNQDSDSVTVFSRNESTGRLTGPIQTLTIPSPMITLSV